MSAPTLLARRPRQDPPRRRARRRAHTAPGVLAFLIGLAVVVSACGGAASSTATTKPPAPTTTTSTTAPQITTPTVTVNGSAITVPRETPGIPIQALQDTGQQVVLTSGGFLPRTLYAALQTPIVWTNLTDKTVTISLVSVPGVAPATVAPGATWSWVPTELAFHYKASTGDWGIVYVGAFGF